MPDRAPALVLPFPLPHSPALDRRRPTKTPHDPATVAAVRLLYERSTLAYAEIARETGVSQASVCRYAQAGGWRRPPGSPKATTSANGLPSPRLQGRMLARRLRDICGRYLDDMERQPDLRDLPDGNAVLAMLRMAKEEERRKPRRPLAARAVAERYLDQLERDPEPDPEASPGSSRCWRPRGRRRRWRQRPASSPVSVERSHTRE